MELAKTIPELVIDDMCTNKGIKAGGELIKIQRIIECRIGIEKERAQERKIYEEKLKALDTDLNDLQKNCPHSGPALMNAGNSTWQASVNVCTICGKEFSLK